jgi:signal transduction histidine kinase
MSQNKLSKQSSQIARSLTLSYFFSLISLFFVLNIIIVSVLTYGLISEVEEQVHQLRQYIIINNDVWAFPVDDDQNITFEKVNIVRETQVMNFIFTGSAMRDATYRSFGVTSSFRLSNPHSYNQWVYKIEWIEGNQPLSATILLESRMPRYIVIFLGFIMVQFFLLISSTIKQSVRIHRQLNPLQSLSSTTKVLKKDIAQLAVSVDMDQLNSITKAIEKIDAYKLDHPIQIDAKSQELAVLTDTINEMLIRINQAVILQTEFVSNASHELRTPISVIQGYVNLLDRWGKNDPATLQESIDAIKDETENMKTLVENLLFLARGDSDNIQLMLEQVHLKMLFEEIIKETGMIHDEQHIKISCDESLTCVADRQLLKQAIRIIMDNALKYSVKDATIFMRAHQQDQELVISIADEGIGISPQSIDKVFDRFYRDEQARVVKTKGAGLGLSIAKWIVEKHHGSIQIISRQNIGTKVSITLPVLNR